MRAAALKNKVAVVQHAKQLFDDYHFRASIESTTKSLDNYRTRFQKYREMMESCLQVKLPPLDIATE